MMKKQNSNLNFIEWTFHYEGNEKSIGLIDLKDFLSENPQKMRGFDIVVITNIPKGYEDRKSIEFSNGLEGNITQGKSGENYAVCGWAS